MPPNCRSPLNSLTLALALLTSGPAAMASDASLANALRLAEQGLGQQALQILEPHQAARTGDPEFDLVLAIAYNQTGQFSQAVFALERVLALQPGNPRARAEMARALFGVGNARAARALFEETRQQPIPASALGIIDQYLAAIDQIEDAGRSSLKGYVEFGLAHDTNINSGPGISAVAVPLLGGLQFTLNPQGRARDGALVHLGAGFNGRHVLDPRWSVIGQGSINLREPVDSGNSDLDSQALETSVGLTYRAERHEYSAVGQFSIDQINGSVMRRSLGTVGQWTYRPDGLRQFTGYAQYARLAYPGQTLRDADRYVVGGGYARIFSDGWTAFGGAYIGREANLDSSVPHLGHKLWGLRAGGQKAVGSRLVLHAAANLEHRRFGGVDPLFLVTRTDRQLNLSAGMAWTPWALWRISPQITWSQTQSSVPISAHRKTVLGVTARREF